MPASHPPRKAAVLVVLLALCGCPKRFDPRADTLRSSPDAQADEEYHQARARLDVGDNATARDRFADFVRLHPDDPLAPSARLGEARAELALGQIHEAKSLLEPLARTNSTDPAAQMTEARARYLLGITLHRTGSFARSRQLLTPFEADITPGDQAVELHAVLADDSAHLGDTDGALREYSLFFAGARPPEKLYLKDRVSTLVAKLPATEAARLWDQSPKDTLAAAYLGKRVAADRRAGGDEPGAKVALEESESARERFGLEEGRGAAPRVASERSIGLLLPLSGRGRALGERAVRGALLAAGLLNGRLPQLGQIDLRVRDTGSDPARAATAVDELAKEGVVAIVGSPDRLESALAAPRAEKLGVPYLELAPDDAHRGELVFKLVRPRAAGAEALARQAQAAHAHTVGTLAPDSNYGRLMAQAFAEAARAEGLRVVADLRYPPGTTTFVDLVKQLQAAHPQAIFVPAPASELELIAPQLASTGLTPMPGVRTRGRTAHLYATADGINDRFLASTGKYLEGAVLAPVFYADPEQPRIAQFVDGYRTAYGEEPSSLDALTYDAVHAVRVALDHTGTDEPPRRDAIATSLEHLGEPGLTGALSFTASGDRAGAPPLYEVQGGAVHLLR